MTTPDSTIQKAAQWAAEEFERRTLEIARGTYKVQYMCPSTRVSWHEITAKFGLNAMGPTDRVTFQPLFDKEIKRRKLTRVLRGTEKSDQWARRVGKL